jgi:ATP-binding cassette subfamily B protein
MLATPAAPRLRLAALSWRRRYPVRRQLEESDCGPACLEMIAAYHGAEHAQAVLRELTHVRALGTTLLDVAKAAERLGFRARGVHLEDASELEDEEGQTLLPAIAHWDGNHFVVLYALNAREAVVGDPAQGLRRIPRQELARHWQGILLLLEPTALLHQPQAVPVAVPRRPSPLRRFGRELLRYRLLLVSVVLATLLLQGVVLAQPLLIQALVDKAVGRGDLSLLTGIGVALGVLLATQVAVTLARGAALFLLSSSYSLRLLTRFWQRLLSLPLSFFARRHRGDLLQRIEDHQRIRRILQGAAASVLLDLVLLVGYAAVLFLYDGVVFSLFVGSAVLYAGCTLVLLPRRSRLDTERFRVGAEASRLELQMLGGIQTLKATGAERQMRAAWERLQAQDFAASRRLWRLDSFHQGATLFINQAMYVGILLYEAWLVLQGRLSVGQLVATLAILTLVLAPLQNLVTFLHELQDVALALRRVDVLYEAEPELSDAEGPPVPALTRAPEIRLEHVTFQYGSPNEPPILEDVSLTLPAGKMTAIVGRSGAGKTTLAHLLHGLYRPRQGRILYDGVPLECIPPASLRRSVAYVFQKTDIFDGTLAENIALGDEHPDGERLLHAARTACLDDLLALPQGMDTRIGESGIRLSGGEEQRLQLARAIYREPRVLFLDEATSHLDAATERTITESLKREAEGRTVVVVAHRLSTVRRADLIVVLDHGRVVEQGTHEVLLAREGGHYRALVENQMEGG